MVLLAIFVAAAILTFPRNGRWFVRWQTRTDGVKERFWRHAGGWELLGLGLLVALLLQTPGGAG
ncbi:MAG: hypothetical protein ACRDXB_06380 [Actinomycetes bacterium]